MPSFDADVVEFLLSWQALEVASRHVRERFASAAGLSLTDFQTLVFLSAHDGSPARAIGESLGLTTGATTALVDRLEKAGYVRREPHPSDRRSTLTMLTDTGLAAATEAGALYAGVTARVLSPQERPAATALFRRLAAELEPGSDSPR